METVSNKDTNGCVNKPVVVVASLDCRKVEDHVNRNNYSDSNYLLPLPKSGGISRNLDKSCRRVQWNDAIGNKLVEVLEYELR